MSPGTSATVSCRSSGPSTTPRTGSSVVNGIVGDLRLRVRETPEQRRLAGVREAGERRIDHELEPKLELELFSGKAGLRKARRLTRGSREPRVSSPTLPSARDDDARIRHGEVGDEPALAVDELRPDGNAELRSLAVGSVLLAPAPVAAARGLDLPDAPERGKVAERRIHGHDHVSPAATVAAVRPALRDVLLAAEAQPTVAPAPGLDLDVCAVVEHGSRRGRGRRATPKPRPR